LRMFLNQFFPRFSALSKTRLTTSRQRTAELKYSSNLRVTDQILFLVGGLGSNHYLAEYLGKQIPSGIEVQQPPFGYYPLHHSNGLFQNERHHTRRCTIQARIESCQRTCHARSLRSRNLGAISPRSSSEQTENDVERWKSCL